MERAGPPPETPAWPDGLRVRRYQHGDAAAWADIHESAGVYSSDSMDLFHREFGDHPELLGARQVFVEDDGEPVATGTAWIAAPRRSDDWGRLHWIAVRPSHQRRGIATALVRHLLGVFADLGCTRVFLTTGAENLKAIALYRTLGFTMAS